MEKEEVYQKILIKVIGFLAFKPRTRKEVSMRLERYLESQGNLTDDLRIDITQKIFDYLELNKLINDEEYTELFVASKIEGRKALGKRAIANKLVAKGISRDDAEKYVDAAVNEDDELKAAVGLAEKKYGSVILNLSYGERGAVKDKMGRYLLSRGFSYSTSRQAVDYLLKRP